MQFSVTFRHMEATEALKDYAKERMDRIKKYFPDPISCHVVMSTFRYNHRVDVNLQLHNGLQIGGHEITEDMYSSIDLVVAKIERQVKRYKSKLRSHRSRSEIEPVPVAHTVIEEAGVDVPRPAHELESNVVRREKFEAKPMSVDAAIMQLNLLHEQFLVFLNDASGDVNVVYRRNDGSYGLIETGAQA